MTIWILASTTVTLGIAVLWLTYRVNQLEKWRR